MISLTKLSVSVIVHIFLFLYIFLEKYIHNKKYKEVAEELNVSVAAIHKNIVKALRILREELGQKGNRN